MLAHLARCSLGRDMKAEPTGSENLAIRIDESGFPGSSEFRAQSHLRTAPSSAVVSMLEFGQDVPGLRRPLRSHRGTCQRQGQALLGSRRPRCHHGTSPGRRSTTSWTVTAAQVTTARNDTQKHRVHPGPWRPSRSSRQLSFSRSEQPGSRRQFVSPRQPSRGS